MITLRQFRTAERGAPAFSALRAIVLILILSILCSNWVIGTRIEAAGVASESLRESPSEPQAACWRQSASDFMRAIRSPAAFPCGACGLLAPYYASGRPGSTADIQAKLSYTPQRYPLRI